VARKPTLSPTKISTYLACPAKYYWTYIDLRGKWYIRAKSHYSFGTTLHQVLQRFHDEGDQGVTTINEALQVYEENWIDAGFTSAEEMAEAFGDGKEILERHVERAQAEPRGTRTVFVERQLRVDFGEFALIGRIDRLDEHPDGTLEVVDYKSGRQTVDLAEVETDIAMGIYQLLVRRAYPGRMVKATIIALRSGDEASASLSDEAIADLEFDIRELGREIQNRNYEELVPVRKALCERCDFLPLCRKQAEFGEI